jgi:hypothetical protein
MIHWGWLVVAVSAGAIVGMVMIGLMAAGASEYCYRQGFQEGYAAGFNDGVAQITKVG